MNILRSTSYKILMLLAIVIFIVFACSNEELDEDFLNHQGSIENKAPIAVAEATPLSGNIPLDVDFIGNNSSDDFLISNYYWNFNDGTTSDNPDPSHMFKSVGRHIVKLTVEDELGLKHTDTIIITVNDSNGIAPKAIISADPPSGIAPLEVEFNGSDSTDDEGVSNYFWEFKDGSTSNKAIVSHTFDSIGAFYVKLTVKDEMGLTHKDSIAINVKDWENGAPIALANASPLKGSVPLNVSFTGSNSTGDSDIVSYTWDFKDGSTSDKADVQHTFETVGVYNVELTVRDEIGLTQKDSISIIVNEPDNEFPVAVPSASPLTGRVPLEVSFTGSNSTDDNGIEKYTWDFKDGSTSNKADVQHTFETAGTYDVQLTVEDEMGLEHKEELTITVNAPDNEPPVAVPNASPLTGTVPLEVNFTGSNSTDDNGIAKYVWDFKDGSTSNKADVKHTFETEGTYDVELAVEDEMGLEHKRKLTIIVNEPDNEPPVAVPSASPLTGTVPLEVNFTGSNSTDDNGIEKYAWDFKDGSTSNKADVQHTFETAGTYNVQLTVEDEMGLEHQEELTITVNAPDNQPPVAVPNASPLTGTVPLEVSFTGSNSTDDNGIENYAWDFKDGSTSNNADVQHTFETAGTYDVQLTVEDEMGLEHKEELTITVNAPDNEPPVAVPSGSPLTGTVPLEVNFTGSNSTDDNGIEKYTWDFKDGSTSNKADVQHTFDTAGTYDVELTVEDEMGLKHKRELNITVSEPENEAPVAVANASPLRGTLPLEVSFTGSNSTDDNGIESYSWNFKDGSNSNIANPTHTFDEAGTYDVELTVEDEMGLTNKKSVTITVSEPENEAPVAVANASPRSGSVPLQVNFTGSNSTDDNGIESYSWDFKDGSSSNNANPSHTFNTVGSYNVELTVEDESGLSHKNTVIITVNPPPNQAPNAIADASPQSGEAPLQVNFSSSNSSDDKGIVGYLWNIPGNTSSSPNVTHTFNEPGTYNISLTVNDAEGLQDTATVTINVTEGQTGGGQIPCSVGSGRGDKTGAKIWCWENINVPAGTNGNEPFSNGDLGLSIECNANQVTNSGNRLRFYLNPTNPNPASWCNNNFNMRAEIHNNPWNVDHSNGTEEWFGWSYTFGNNYIADKEHNWVFFQSHEGTVGTSPLISMQVLGHRDGEISLVNASQSGPNNTYINTGVRPTAGETVDIVLHIIWGDESNGLLQLWMNGNKVYDAQVRTVRATTNVGGNAKFGIYYSDWRSASGVQASAQQGISDIETFMGPLRMILRRPSDSDYRKDSYSEVAPD